MRFVPFTTIKYNAHVNPNEFGTWQGAWVATETYLDIEKVESVAKVETFDDDMIMQGDTTTRLTCAIHIIMDSGAEHRVAADIDSVLRHLK